jgi:hypothetical protein
VNKVRLLLLADIYFFFKWLFGVSRVFTRNRPFSTLSLIALSVLSRITSVLAFLLPLKVILLAGSDGVPAYFRFFLEPEDKQIAVIWLTLAAVASYFLTLLFEWIAERLALSGSSHVLQGATRIHVTGSQRDMAQSFYSRNMRVVAAFIFVCIGFSIIAVINVSLLIAISGFIVFSVLFTSLCVDGAPFFGQRLKRYIVNNHKGYLKLLGFAGFMLGFFVILIPFVRGVGGNSLYAIAAVLILRRGFGVLSPAVADGVDLYRDRRRYEPLIFRGRRLVADINEERRMLENLFSKTNRTHIAELEINRRVGRAENFDSEWLDSPVPRVYTFCVSSKSEHNCKQRFFHHQVFPRSYAYLLENEELLFSKIKRKKLKAPPALSRFEIDGFECRICEYGNGKRVKYEQWKTLLPGLLRHYWTIEPPRSLVFAYQTAKYTLPDRLTVELIQRLSIAVDTRAERNRYGMLLESLKELQARLKSLPLQIFNPDLKRTNLVHTESGGVHVVMWPRWAIEPIGIDIPDEIARSSLDDVVESVNESRNDVHEGISLDDIDLSNACWKLERRIHLGNYKLALDTVGRIVRYLG